MNKFHVWLTDCDSLYEHLVAPKMATIDNKRLAIDLQALRQDIWELTDDDKTEYIDTSYGDYPRWIDTSTMISDPLTKVMLPTRLLSTMTTGILDLRPTAESLAIKEKNRLARKEKKLSASKWVLIRYENSLKDIRLQQNSKYRMDLARRVRCQELRVWENVAQEHTDTRTNATV